MAQVIGYLVLACVAAGIAVWLRRAAFEDRASGPLADRCARMKAIAEPKVLRFSQSVDARKVIGLKR
jgi:hypothetical protein